MWHSEKYLGPCPISVMEVQKQPSIGVLRKKYSENVYQIYRKTPMPKCDFKAWP